MNSFWMICDEIADFGPNMGVMFRVREEDIGKPLLAPGWVKKTILYQYMLAHGKLRETMRPPETAQDGQKAASGSGKGKPEGETGEAPESPSEAPETDEATEPVKVTATVNKSGRSKKGEAK